MSERERPRFRETTLKCKVGGDVSDDPFISYFLTLSGWQLINIAPTGGSTIYWAGVGIRLGNYY